MNQDSASRALESHYSTLQRDWDTTELPPGHELEEVLYGGRKLLTTLTAELDTHKARTASTPSILSSSFSSRDSDWSEEGKLPSIEVPLFHGDIMKWSSFWANFKSTIDSRERLSDTAKLIYLRKAIGTQSVRLCSIPLGKHLTHTSKLLRLCRKGLIAQRRYTGSWSRGFWTLLQ